MLIEIDTRVSKQASSIMMSRQQIQTNINRYA